MSDEFHGEINTASTGGSERDGTILVIGSINMDLYTRINHIPEGGETIMGSPIWTSPGGKGANQAAAAGRLGGQVRFVGCIGDDEHGLRLRQGLEDAGVDTTLLRVTDSPSSVAMILLTPDGQNAIIVSPSSNQHVSPALADEAWHPGAPRTAAVVCQLEIPLDTVIHASELAEAHGAQFVLNAAPAQELPPELLARCNPLIVNESEAAMLLGLEHIDNSGSPTSVVEGLLALGPRSVVVTLGGDGVVVGDENGPAGSIRGHAVPVVDTTGAGDAFVAALTTRLVAGDDLMTAAHYANVVGALVVQSEGAQASYPSPDEVAEQLEKSINPLE